MDVTSTVFDKAINAQHMIRCIVELTPLCNLSCEMCGISLASKDIKQYGRILTTKDWLCLIEQMADDGVLFLTFSGGEPLLHPGFEELYLFAYTKGFIIDIRTNGLLLPKYRDLLKTHPPKQISISVYGSSDEMYHRMTGNKDGFHQLIESLNTVKYINCPLHITCTMTKTNVDCFDDVARLAEEYNASFGMITDIFPHVRGYRQNINTRLSPAECASIAHFPPSKVQNALQVSQILENRFADRFSLHEKEQSSAFHLCASCQIAACIKWDGRMTFCPEMESVYSRPLILGVSAAWIDLLNKRNECIAPNHFCEKCGIRQYCKGACPARFYLETNSYTVPAKHICETAYYSKILCETEDISV